jgi:NDP-sugar pyrophosphorylase family protein
MAMTMAPHSAIPDPSSLQVVILAGGKGTRLAPLTDDRPKALVQVAGEPFCDRQLRLLRANGARRVLYAIGHMADRLRDHLGDGARFGLDIGYVEDGEVPLGTAGALRKAADLGLLEDRFLVTYGDSYLPIPLAPVMARLDESGAPAVMTVFKNDGRWDGSNVAAADGWVSLYDKRGRHPEVTLDHIDYGMLAMRRSFLEAEVPSDTFVDLAEPLYAASLDGRLAAHTVTSRFWEMGSHSGLAELEAALRTGAVPAP